MTDVLFLPLNQNHVLIFEQIIKELTCTYVVLCHDRISEAQQYHTESILVKKNLHYVHFPQKIRRTPDDTFFLRIRHFSKMKKQIKKVLQEISPDLVVLAIDNDPISQTIITESRKMNIGTVLVPEGLIKPHDFFNRVTYFSDYFYRLLRVLGIYLAYIMYGTGDCDVILVSGKRSLDILKNIGVPESKMKIVGQQKYDSFLAKIRDLEPLSHEPKAYLYAASTRIFENAGEIEFINKLVSAATKLGFHLIVKLHPRVPHETQDLYNLLQVDNSTHLQIVKEGYETFDILSTVYAVVTISSAIVLEGLMMDKECIVATYLAGRRRFDYDSYDAIYSIDDAGEIDEILKTSMLLKKNYTNKKRLLEDEIYRLDGKAGQRTAKLIEEMLAEGEE